MATATQKNKLRLLFGHTVQFFCLSVWQARSVHQFTGERASISQLKLLQKLLFLIFEYKNLCISLTETRKC